MLSEKLKELQNMAKRACKSEKTVFDIAVFGSSVKEKTRPEDIDICIIFSSEMKQDEIKRISGLFKGYHVEHLFLFELYKEPLWQTLIHEGCSLTEGKPIHEILGFKSRVLFKYNLEKLVPVKKSMFSHALFGRGGKQGILNLAGGMALGRGSVMVPVGSSEKIREFLETWGVEYSVMKILSA